MLQDGCEFNHQSVLLHHHVILFVQRNLVKRLFHPQTCRSVRRIKNGGRGFDLRSETARNATGVGKSKGWQKENRKHSFLQNSRFPANSTIRFRTLTSANICIRKSRPNICLRAGSNIRPLENFSHLLRFLSSIIIPEMSICL